MKAGYTIPRIQTQHLVLRALVDEDAPALFAYASDPEVTRCVLWPRQYVHRTEPALYPSPQ